MKKVVIVIFDQFTDIDLFLLWDILSRDKDLWSVQIAGAKAQHISSNNLSVATHVGLKAANEADVVLFASGKGTREIIKDQEFLSAFSLNPETQVVGSICSGALILAQLGLLQNKTATTHPRAKDELKAMGIDVVDLPLVSHKNIATAGGCLAAQYLAAWVIEHFYGVQQRQKTLYEIFPVGQQKIYDDLVTLSITEGSKQ